MSRRIEGIIDRYTGLRTQGRIGFDHRLAAAICENQVIAGDELGGTGSSGLLQDSIQRRRGINVPKDGECPTPPHLYDRAAPGGRQRRPRRLP